MPTDDRPTASAALTRRQVRDLFAVLLITGGVVGLVAVAWVWHPMVGGAAACIAAILAGVALGWDGSDGRRPGPVPDVGFPSADWRP